MELQNPNLNRKDRVEFLKAWDNKYPEAVGVGFLGLIVFSEEKIWIERDGEKNKLIKLDHNTVFKDPFYQEFSPSRVLISGDWVECEQRNDDKEDLGLIEIEAVHLLSPNLADEGHRLDLNQNIIKWNQFITKINLFFNMQGFNFINTPTLVSCPGTEPFIDPFKTDLVYGSIRSTFYLPTSPEIHLKKCLAKGWDKIYEIRSCFRNGEFSSFHQPEFYLLEWYRAFAPITEIQKDIQKLIEFLLPENNNYKKPWNWLSVAELFQRYLNFDLRPTTTVKDLIQLASRLKIDLSKADDFDEAFYFIFVEKIEPRLSEFELLFIYNYPPSQAALARLTSDGWGNRFEFYIKGVEIANSFAELNNPVEQRLRSNEDINKKKKYSRASISLDEDFFIHLERGMPPASGIALGLDRLFMVLMEISDIKDLRIFPLIAP